MSSVSIFARYEKLRIKRYGSKDLSGLVKFPSKSRLSKTRHFKTFDL